MNERGISTARALVCAALAGSFVATAAHAQTPAPTVAPAAAAEDGGFFARLVKAYADEWGPPAAPDPNAPASRRADPFPPSPVNSPPQPFTEWPFGGATTIGATLPASIDSPLMTALAPTELGQALADSHVQIYGWVEPGGNASTSSRRKGGNAPADYSYDPNNAWLDQAVVVFERLPDTVQQDHVDWGFRVSPLYGADYRYTTAYGLMSNQLQKSNAQSGFDVMMAYGELYIPGVAQGLIIRAGRYSSVPDIESQFAPYNYMYSRSMMYGVVNSTNTGVLGSLLVTNELMLQFGITDGSDTMPWMAGSNRFVGGVNTTYPPRDPGVQPSFTACIRYESASADDAIYGCLNGINNGAYGYNNLQEYAVTYFHKFNDQWHFSAEAWDIHQNGVPNANYGGASPSPNIFSALANGPYLAQCAGQRATCRAEAYAAVGFLNYQIGPMDNITLRLEFLNDQDGQRTGYRTRYLNSAIGWQHWLSPTITLRPEIALYDSLDAKAFNASPAGGALSPASARTEVVGSMDVIWHF